MALYAIKNGVPYDVAFSLYDWELLAYFVGFAQFDSSNQFDWEALRSGKGIRFIER